MKPSFSRPRALAKSGHITSNIPFSSHTHTPSTPSLSPYLCIRRVRALPHFHQVRRPPPAHHHTSHAIHPAPYPPHPPRRVDLKLLLERRDLTLERIHLLRVRVGVHPHHITDVPRTVGVPGRGRETANIWGEGGVGRWESRAHTLLDVSVQTDNRTTNSFCFLLSPPTINSLRTRMKALNTGIHLYCMRSSRPVIIRPTLSYVL